jgi:hypothetical protein
MTRSRKKVSKVARAEKQGIPIDAVGAPIEGTVAGDAGDVGRERMLANVRSARASANRHFQSAQRLVGQASASAEREARLAIGAIVTAFWWAEDSDEEEAQHILMHKIGRWTRRRFGCSVAFEDGRYLRRCPIDIAHKRFGFSVGYTATLLCSICGDDVSECPHLRSKAYWVRGGVGPSGYCPVCMGQACQHDQQRLYRVTVSQIVTNMKAREVSLVSRPAGVTTRLTELPLSSDELRAKFGPDFEVGMPVSCDLCLGSCWGFTELSDNEAG